MNNSIYSIFLKKIGGKITQIREDQKLTKTQLAFEMETSEKYIRRIENGEVNLGAITLFKLSQALNVPIKELFDFE